MMHSHASAGFLTLINMAATVDDVVATCPLQCPEDTRPADTRSAECIAADLADETKAALCHSESRKARQLLTWCEA